MKYSLFLIIFSLFFSAIPAFSSSYGEEGREINFQQPGVGKIKLLVKGSQYYARTVTAEGYTVVYRSSDQTYYYAQLNAKADGFVPTRLKVGVDQPVGLVKDIKINPEARKKQWEVKYKAQNADLIKLWQKRVKAAQKRRFTKGGLNGKMSAADIALATVEGKKVGVTILAQFPDDPNTAAVDPINFPVEKDKIDRFCNLIGYTEDGNTDSFRGYYKDQSLGKLDYSMIVTDVVTLPHPRDYYNYEDYPANKVIRENIGIVGQLLIKDAIEILKKKGFSFDSLSVDRGKVISTNIFFAGEDSGVWAKGLWPHASIMRESVKIQVDGKDAELGHYQITNMPNAQTEIGTFIHENGHLLLGFPDLYDYDHDSRGIGRYGLMSSGNYLNRAHTPASICLPLKEVVGWANITDITKDDYLLKDLPTNGNVGYRIKNEDNPKEYFLIENRGDGNRWEQYLPDKGISIWHVDEGVSGNNANEMTPTQHYQVSLEQSDGKFDLEKNVNSGDENDLFDVASPLFDDTTTPNANWWDGSKSGIRIQIKSASGAKMQVEFGIMKNTIVVISPNGGEELHNNTSSEITWNGSFLGTVKIDLFKNGLFLKNLATKEENDGTYTWNLGGGNEVASDYSIHVTSELDNTITDASDANFSIVNSELSLSESAKKFDFSKGSSSFTVKSNTKWSWSSNVSWITSAIVNPQTGNQEFTYTVDENTTGKERVGTITFTAGSLSVQYKVTQGFFTPELVLSQQENAVSYQNQNSSFTVKSNTKWSWSANVAWINTSENPKQGGDQVFDYTIDKNLTLKKRVGIITFKAGSLIVKHRVIQGFKPELSVAQSVKLIDYLGGASQAMVKSNTKWTWSSNATWITAKEGSVQDGNQAFDYVVAKNMTGKERNGIITFKARELEVQYRIVQTPRPTLELSASSKLISYKGGTSQLAVNSNRKWSWSSNVTWITSKEENLQTGDQDFVYTVAKNTTGKKREGKITFKAGTLSMQYRVIQNPEPRLTLSESVKSIDYSGGLIKIVADSNVKWSWSSNVNWITSSEANPQIGKQDFECNVAQNMTGKERVGVITFTSATLKVQYKVTQAYKPELALSSTYRSFKLNGGKSTFTVNSNTEWTWSSNVPWITSSEAVKQKGKQLFSYSVLQNKKENQRSGVITFSYDGKTVQYNVTQSFIEKPKDAADEIEGGKVAADKLSAGKYAGFLTDEATGKTAGYLKSLKLKSNGKFSAKWVMDGSGYSLKGELDSNGAYAATVKPKRGLAAKVSLQLVETKGGSFKVLGTVTRGSELVQLIAVKSGHTSKIAGKYTLLLIGSDSVNSTSRGYAHAVMTVTSKGKAKVKGLLADGGKWTGKCFITTEGEMPLYSSLYKKLGSLAGMIRFRDQKGISDCDGGVNWQKNASFSRQQDLIGSRFRATGGILMRGLEVTGPNIQMLTSNPLLSNVEKWYLKWSPKNKIGRVSTKSVKVKINTKTGFVSGKIQESGQSWKVKGVFFQKQNISAGLLLKGNRASGFSIIKKEE